MPRRTVIPLVVSVLLASCAAPSPAPGALPPGIEQARIPPVAASAFIYVRPPNGATFSHEAMGIEGLTAESASVLLADDGRDHLARLAFAITDDLGSMAPAAPDGHWVDVLGDSLVTGPESAWGLSARAAWERQDLVTIHSRFPDAWKDLVKAPRDPPSQPIAAGFVRNFGPLIKNLIGKAGADVPGLTSNLALLRIESVSFVAYSDRLDTLPLTVEPGLLEDESLSVLAIADSAYPRAIVGWLFDRFVGTLDLADVRIDDWPARYRQVASSVHVIILRHDATLFFAIAPTRAGAEDLAGAVVRSVGGR